ncbi:putative D-tyrosyl-tRNA(Tyr) deacylase 1 [Hypsibius exemplaris]|uniref:D-aminoacyl-tRNA deacylase n=1 Tax=Hypsibius exemplaris TaxID=2072580 RepID=A0A1W0X665_HYPEX|nr:putative D-tyrosyl-tRNA(Tyr) deacylase 1 [Hypsibius exemplaris]
MRAVVQRVFHASIRPRAADSVEEPRSISAGLLIFLGIHRTDQSADLEWMVKKILGLRLFDAEDGSEWKLTVKEAGAEILCISQYTLLAITSKGSKPDFHECMPGAESEPMYEKVLTQLGKLYAPDKIQKGFFGVTTRISCEMNGPVTITLDSPKKNPAPVTTKVAVVEKPATGDAVSSSSSSPKEV